jgi:hypothetical protein
MGHSRSPHEASAEVSRPVLFDEGRFMAMPFGLPPPDPAIELFVASRGMTQGLSQSNGPQVIPRAYVRFGEVQVGAFWRNIDSPIANGIGVLFGRAAARQGRTQLDVVVLYRTRTGARRPTVLHAWEIDTTLRHSFGRVGVRLNVEYAPREFELGPSIFVEIGPTVRLAKNTILFANLGRRERTGAPDYTAVNAGISHAVGKSLVVDGRYYATDRSVLGPRYRGRLVFSARLSL